MPFNGSGTFSPHSPEYPVVAGTTIRASDWNTIVADIATGLSNTICRDGQSSPTADINWGGKKVANLASGTTAGDALAYGQDVATVTQDSNNFKIANTAYVDAAVGKGYDNRIINGACRVSQYPGIAIGGTGSTFYGPVDRLFTSIGATAISASVIQADQTSVPPAGVGSFGYAWRVGIGTSTGTISFAQGTRLEALQVSDMGGKQVTFSVRVWQDTGSSITFVPEIDRATAKDNFTGLAVVALGGNIVVPTGVATTISMTVTLGASDAINGLQCKISAVGFPAVTGKRIDTSDWYFGLGAETPSVIERTSYQLELEKCMRYYQNAAHSACGSAIGVNFADFAFQLPVKMRAFPTFTALNTTSRFVSSGPGASSIAGTWTAEVVNTTGVGAVFTRAAGTWTAGQAIILGENTTPPFNLSAEL